MTFTKAGDFWTWLVSEAEPDRKLIVLAYNAGFDVRITEAFKHLARLGYAQEKIFIGQTVLILSFRRGKHVVTILDACNYFDGTLETWGGMLGLPKIPVNFRRCSVKRLMEHCRRDVEILEKLWLKWVEFCDVNDLGHFTPTRSAQALSAFTHRYMKHTLFLHADTEATHLERAGYYGGRVECFRVGKVPGKRFHKLDVTAMYPAVMLTGEFPVKLLGVFSGYPIAEVEACLVNLLGVADVVIDTPCPVYPYRRKSGIIFPTGRFQTVLAGVELSEAIKAGHVVHVGRVALYRKAVIFHSFVADMYSLRQRYQRDGNEIFAAMVKKVMNSLYGKFGQHSEVWEKEDTAPGTKDGFYMVMNDTTGKPEPVRVIAGTSWTMKGRKESYHSFPAISACITAAARFKLWTLIQKAGRENVFYCDTDSLIVNDRGRANLAEDINPGKLGMLKLEYTTGTLSLNAPKDYDTGREVKTKGVPKKARALTGNRFRFWSWQGLTGALHTGSTGAVKMTLTTKTLARQYDKGTVLSSGAVEPLQLHL